MFVPRFLQEMFVPRYLQEMFVQWYQPEMSDQSYPLEMSVQSCQLEISEEMPEEMSEEMSDPSNQLLPEMSDPSNQPLPDSTHDTHPEQYKSRPNHPCDDLLAGTRTDYINICVPLYEASIKGDWEAAENIIDNNPKFNLLEYSITEDKDTILMVATMFSQSIKFVGHVVNRMTHQQLTLQDKYHCTALHTAAEVGNVEMAKAMVEKCPQLMTIRDRNKHLPIHFIGKHDMVDYLYGEYKNMVAGNDWTYLDKCKLFLRCIKADLFDFALQILDDQNKERRFPSPEQISDDQNKESRFPSPYYAKVALCTLARKTYAFKDIKSWKNSITWVRPAMIRESVATKLLRKFWKNIMERPRDEINDILKGPRVTTKDNKETYPFQIQFVAAEMGNTKFLVELIRGFPDLLWSRNENKHSIFHIAVSHRHESIYNLLYEMGPVHVIVASFADEHKNNLSHVVGMKAKSLSEDVSGAAFQMQRELLWFKEVTSKIYPYSREKKNEDGYTPLQLFIKDHKDMVSEGEKWMKDTASQCMVVAALITTVVFAVAFTVPGGYDQNNGLPIFRKDGPFIVFVILDAISLILSSASILMFLSILTSRFAQEDFLISLPKKLMIGLTTLFLSIITMMVAFAVSFFVLYRNKLIPIPIIISVGAVVPIFLYMKLQFPLLVDVYRSTYGSRYLFRPKKRVLYYRNPRF